MSVLMMGKKKQEKKKSKPKTKSKTPAPPALRNGATAVPPDASTQKDFNPTPPLSNERTSVWHWVLDDTPTTLMFNKESCEVWCNGETLQTSDGFPEDTDGGVIDFFIPLNGNMHKSRIKRLSSSSKKGAFQLYVNGCMILEHTAEGYSPCDQLNPFEGVKMEGAEGPPPPPYYVDPEEPKKYK